MNRTEGGLNKLSNALFNNIERNWNVTPGFLKSATAGAALIDPNRLRIQRLQEINEATPLSSGELALYAATTGVGLAAVATSFIASLFR